MNIRVVSGIILTLLVIGPLALAFNLQPVMARKIVVPDDYSTIQEAINNAYDGDTIFVRNGTYYEHVVVNRTVSLIGQDREKTVIDGSGIESDYIVEVTADNATISGFTVRNATYPTIGGLLVATNFSNIVGNTVATNDSYGIGLGGYGNIIAGNNITDNFRGIIGGGHGHTISRNIISDNGNGMCLNYAENNTIISNTIINNGYGIWLHWDVFDNTIIDNVIANNGAALDFFMSTSISNNTIYHNNFINNTVLVSNNGYIEPNIWDNGYPSGGNYWSDYTGEDLYSGPYQNETGSDGIGDTPYSIRANNTDNYPLVTSYTPLYDLAVLNASTSKTFVGQGYCLSLNVTIENLGSCTELLFVTAYANTTTIAESGPVTLASGKQTTLILLGDTTGLAKGNHIITAYVHPVPDETDTTDNNLTDGTILVTIPGDINGDHICDMKDIFQLILYFMCKIGEPCYVANCDINCDGVIDIKDIFIAILHFGES